MSSLNIEHLSLMQVLPAESLTKIGSIVNVDLNVDAGAGRRAMRTRPTKSSRLLARVAWARCTGQGHQPRPRRGPPGTARRHGLRSEESRAFPARSAGAGIAQLSQHSMIPIHNLFETHLVVTDLQSSMDFYGGVLGLELARAFPERKVAFYWIGGAGKAMLGLWEVGTRRSRRKHDLREGVSEEHAAGRQIRESAIPGRWRVSQSPSADERRASGDRHFLHNRQTVAGLPPVERSGGDRGDCAKGRGGCVPAVGAARAPVCRTLGVYFANPGRSERNLRI